jgi:hypothetical protein
MCAEPLRGKEKWRRRESKPRKVSIGAEEASSALSDLIWAVEGSPRSNEGEASLAVKPPIDCDALLEQGSRAGEVALVESLRDNGHRGGNARFPREPPRNWTYPFAQRTSTLKTRSPARSVPPRARQPTGFPFTSRGRL